VTEKRLWKEIPDFIVVASLGRQASGCDRDEIVALSDRGINSLGRIVVSLDRECLGAQNAALRPKNHAEAFSIRRLEGGR